MPSQSGISSIVFHEISVSGGRVGGRIYDAPFPSLRSEHFAMRIIDTHYIVGELNQVLDVVSTLLQSSAMFL